MADEIDDPFAGADDEAIDVPEGEFSAEGDDHARIGSTNARARAGGPLAVWRSASRQRQVQWVTAAAILVVVLLLLPTVFSVVGTAQRARAQALATENIGVIELGDDVMDARAQIDPLFGCYAVSATFAPQKTREQMRGLLDETSESVYKNDAGFTQSKVDETKKFFVEQYARGLADQVDPKLDEWYEADWSTMEEAREAEQKLRGNLSIDRIDQLCADVRDLGAALGAVRNEHMEYSQSYVPPPPPPPSPEPTPTETPKKTEEPKEPKETKETKEPEETKEPQPSEDNTPDKPDDKAPETPQPDDGSGGGTSGIIGGGGG